MKRIIATDNAPGAIGPYSQAVEANGMLFISGQLPIDPKTGKFVEGSIKEQTRQSLENTKAILEAAGYTLDHVIKSTCLLKDLADFKDMNDAYGEFYQKDCPARAAYQVVKLPLDAMIEIETIAAK